MKTWVEELTTELPEELQVIAPGLYMQRRNIRKVEYAERDGQPAHSGYACECREITESELRMLESIEEINTDKAVTAAIDKYTEELIMEGVIG